MTSTGIPNEVGRWCPSLDESGNGTTTVYDLSVNSNNASFVVMTGAAWEASTGSGGVRGIRHNANSHVVDTGVKAIPTNDFTLSAWVNTITLAGTPSQVVIADSVSGGVLLFASDFYVGSGGCRFFGGGGHVGGADIRGTGWRHLCGVRKGTIGYLYVDGQLEGTVTGLDPNNNGNATTTTLGSRSNDYHAGLWDDVCIFNRALNTDEIALLAGARGFISTAPTPIGGEIGWWCPSLDVSGNTSNTLYDLSGNGNNGTLTDMDAATDWPADTGSGGVRALDFDGVNDLVLGQVGIPDVGTNSFWVSLWVKPAADLTTQITGGRVFDARGMGTTGTAVGAQLKLYRDGSAVKTFGSIFETTSGNIRLLQYATVGVISQWMHLAVVVNRTANTVTLYSDAVEVGSMDSSAFGSGSMTSPRPWTIGASSNTPRSQLFSGLIDDVRVGLGELSSAAITALASKRGYQPSLGIKRRRINSGLINMGLIR